MFSRQKKERLKDVLIDHVFDHCFNEIVHKVEADGIKINYDNPEQLNDPVIKSLVQAAIKSKSFKAYVAVRDSKYCKLLVADKTVHKSLIEKLESLGFSKGKRLYERIHKAHDFLIFRSYIVKNKPVENEVRLTEKGIRHYSDGKSFEDNYVYRRNSNIALSVSLTSIIIALTALFFLIINAA